MRVVIDGQLWIGHAGDLDDLRTVAEPEDLAIVDLAIDEPVRPLFRDRIYLRIPLLDGAGNPPIRLKLAVDTVASFLHGHLPTLVACSSGMSRSPAVAAFAIAIARQCTPEEGLSIVNQSAGGDIAPALWNDLIRLFAENHDC